jgi:PAS domain S-box-containing protein
MAGNPVRESSTEDATRLRDCLNDFVSLMAQPAPWRDGKPPHVVSGALEALIGRTNELIAANERLTREFTERRQKEQSLRGSELNFQLTVDSIPGMVHTMTATGAVEFVNHQILDYFGKTLEELNDWSTLVHPDDRSRVIELWTRSVATGEPFDAEHRVRVADGTYRWLHARGLPLRDISGNIVRWYNLLTHVDERKRAEEALRQSERQFRLLVETIPALVWRGTPEGELDYLNQRAVEYLGHTAGSLSNGRWMELVHPDHRDATVRRWLQSATTGSSYDDTYQLRRADGQYRWIQSVGEPFRDTEGRIANWYGLVIDIEDRKRTEEALRESERQSRLIVDTIPGLVATLTPAGEVDLVNHQIVEYCGQNLQAMKQWGTNGTVHAEDLPRVVQIFSQAIAAGEPYDIEARIRRFDAVYRWFQIRGLPLRDSNGHIVRWYVLLTDIDGRKKAVEALTRSEAFLMEGQHLARLGNFAWRVATNEITWSEQLYRIYELEIGVPVTLELIRTRVHPEDLTLLEKMIEQARNGDNDFEWQYRLLMPDHSIKYLHAVVHRTRDQHGQLEYIAAVQDVTARRLSEQALDRARSELAHVARVMSLGALTASIAHEVSQPLAGIITNAGTCLRMLDVDPPNLDGARETARRTIRDGNRAADVITQLRALYSKREFTLEPLDLTEAVREVIALSSNDLQRNRIILQPELASDLPIITGDRIQLQQVILNLLRNAADAMVDVHDRPRQLLIKTEREDGDRIRVTVRDAGMGLPPQSMDSLFDAFYTTKSGGMGIGLFVSRSIVERHRGRIWAQPNDGPGATFSFSIPCNPDSVTDTAPPATPT